ncbi:hypothetical protein PG993_001048 [Apiospora rasikravindrae]|uniref:DMAP1-binding domain-containing protein n=1 Tax=Apiospora rasikravindrae TaxID=990691 RepID=A0ABR1UCD6_9PEZI
MAQFDPNLQEKLDELERELEEGDITEKGFQKRRTQLLSQFMVPGEEVAKPTGGLRIHSPDDDVYVSSDGHRGAALAALSSNTPEQGAPFAPPSHMSHADWRPQSSGPPASSHSYGYDHPAGLMRPGGSSGRAPTRPVSPRLVISQPWPIVHNGLRSSNTLRDHGGGYGQPPPGQYDSRTGTMLDSQGYFSDFTGQQASDQTPGAEYGGGAQRYSSSDAFSPTAAMAPPMLTANDLPPPEALQYQLPLEPREVPFAIHDPHDESTAMSAFDNIAAVLRHRGRTTAKLPAYWVLDAKGKEIASITWDKLASRAEKVAQVIRDKSSLYRGDRVALIYRDSEVIDFAIALLGCFIAGVVAVPINDLQDYQKLNLILTSTQAHLALTTDNNLKAFQRDITTQKLNWPKGVEWWKTNEFGSYHPKKKDDVPPCPFLTSRTSNFPERLPETSGAWF